MAAGRPGQYHESMPDRARKLCSQFGDDNDMLATSFGVTIATLHNWKKEHPEFLDAIKEGKDLFDSDTVERSLLHRAIGYSCIEEKVFLDKGEPVIVKTTKHYPPDTTAMIFWLKNRQPARWRDKQEIDQNIEGSIGLDINVRFMNGSDEEKKD